MGGVPLNKVQSGLGWLAGKTMPIKKNKIVVTSYYGRGFSDSPKAIVEALLDSGKELDIVWLTKEPTEVPEGVRCVEYDSAARMTELSTAKIWIDNCRKGAKYKKDGQIYMQVWHGFALKQIEKDVVDKIPDPNYENYAIRDSQQTDLIVSNSRHMTRVYRESFWYDGEVLEFGSPRNDIFFKENGWVRTKVHQALGIPEDVNIVLYAPTFRVTQSLEPYTMDSHAVCEALGKRFGGKWVFVTRLHPNVAKLSDQLPYEDAVDATSYDDIQELLVSADALISDYSSVVFDYMLSQKPCFMYATDIEEYKNDRNFYIPLDEMPFPIAVNNKTFIDNIENFDDNTYRNSIRAFADKYGMIDDGSASRRCADWILSKMEA